MDTIYDSADYVRSRKAYRAQCTFEYFISILAADAFLAKLLDDIGVSDAANGVISSLITAAFLFQLSSIFLVGHIHNIKRTVIISNTLSQLFFISLYLVPFLPFSRGMKTALIILLILLAYFTLYLTSSIVYKWRIPSSTRTSAAIIPPARRWFR